MRFYKNVITIILLIACERSTSIQKHKNHFLNLDIYKALLVNSHSGTQDYTLHKQTDPGHLVQTYTVFLPVE